MDIKINNQIKESHKSDIPNNTIDINKIEEGIHLYGFVKDEDGNSRVIEDNDYSSKKSFENDLRANGYTVNRVNDNRDMYILDNSDYRSINEITTKIKQIEKDIKEGIALPSDKLVLNTLKDILDKAMKISLTENNIKIQETILYHGSPNKNITQLKIGVEKTTGDEFGAGIYLTTDYEEAKQYSDGGRVYKVELDTSNLYNLKDKLPNDIKQIVKNDLIDNKDIYNQIVGKNRKQYIVVDKKEGLNFFNDKKIEWKEKDNLYMGNLPVVNKKDNSLIVSYTDYNDIDSAIDTLTGDDLQKILSHNVGPNVFTQIIINSGYDGIITHNNNWYIIYKNEDKVKIIENKLEETSRNQLLAKTKMQTKSRYDRSTAYKGFSIADIDTTSVFTTNSLRVTCRVGNYWDTVEMEDILYWIQLEAEKNKDFQINTKGITAAIMNSIDGMDIKVDCNCRRFCV